AKERFIALFTAADAARKAALDTGKDYEVAYQAAVAVWNTWAVPLARERRELEESGEWQIDVDIFSETGANDKTRDFLTRAKLDAGSLALAARDWTGKGEREDESSGESESIVKTIECEAINFSGFIFPGPAFFHRADFKGEAFFDGADFKGRAFFARAHFKGPAFFAGAHFKGLAFFAGADFKGLASFYGAQFYDDANFRLADFLAHAAFQDARFYGAADFTAIQSERSFSLKDARFSCQVPRFIQAHFSENPRLDHVKLPGVGVLSGRLPYPDGVTPGKKCDRDDVAAFRALRKMAIQAQDHLTEHEAFKGENRAHRISQTVQPEIMFARQRNWFFWLVSFLYDLLTDYGWSFWRPMFIWGVLLAGMAGVYLGEMPEREAGGYPQGCTSTERIYQAGLLSLHNGLLFASAGQRAFVNRAYVCLYGRKGETVKNVNLPDGLGLLGTLHTLFSAILIFFTLLALRNRFRIK
ncbi:MAG TPA: pentapeptide repeat-containing protein, partial [Rhizobiales bacterium]|nr:pentapeptide repeat-containing protein [Hyphomicrobiales bacterium]